MAKQKQSKAWWIVIIAIVLFILELLMDPGPLEVARWLDFLRLHLDKVAP